MECLHKLGNGFSLGLPSLCEEVVAVVCFDPLFVNCNVAHGWNCVCVGASCGEGKEELEKDKGTTQIGVLLF